MKTISPSSLESQQVYPDRFGKKADEYYCFHCQKFGCLLPEGATEDDEICESCDKKEKL